MLYGVVVSEISRKPARKWAFFTKEADFFRWILQRVFPKTFLKISSAIVLWSICGLLHVVSGR